MMEGEEPTNQEPNCSGLLVRPKGFVEDKPVIRQTGDHNLYIGNVQAASCRAHDMTFDFVLSATSEMQPLTTHHHPLIDGEGNEWPAFKEAVDTARKLYRREGSVLIHCKVGVSRSATLTALVLATEEGYSFRDALTIVQEARPFAMPNPALHELAIIYLAAFA